MFRQQSTVAAAFKTLALPESASEDEVKAAYKKLAFIHHPDKNPDDPDATARFQAVSQANDTLHKHFSRPQGGPPRGFGRGPFGGGFDEEEDDEFYSDDDDSYGHDSEEDFAFFMFMFEEAMRNRFGSRRAFRRETEERHESPQEYSDRLRKQREEQEAAALRRKHEAQQRKERKAYDREQERLAAEKRQQAKVSEKKAKAEAQRQAAEAAARNHTKAVQTKRSTVFAQARKGNGAAVKDGVWEDSVDPAGGEVKYAQFVQTPPKDPQETLLHIAAKHGDADLVQWLDAHSADPEERNSDGLTAFQVALHHGHITTVSHFLEAYPAKDDDSQNIYKMTSQSGKTLLSLAVESREPEVVYFILEAGLVESQDMKRCWTWANSVEGKKHMKPKSLKLSAEALEKVDDISKLLLAYGGFTPPPPSPQASSSPSSSIQSNLNNSPPSQKNSKPPPAPRGGARGRGKARGGRR